MNLAYVRVSTTDQNTERQKANLEKYGIDKYYEEAGKSGKDTNRPVLTDLRNWARKGDTVFVDDFSRLARNVKDLLDIIEEFESNGVKVVSHKENLDTSTPTGKLMLTMMGAIAEFEREILLERQREGIKVAKEAGKYIGGHFKTIPNIEYHYQRYMSREVSKPQLAKELKISRPTLDRLFKEHQAHLNGGK